MNDAIPILDPDFCTVAFLFVGFGSTFSIFDAIVYVFLLSRRHCDVI